MKRLVILSAFALAATGLVLEADAGGKEKSDSKVKARATATKVIDGKQTVTITLDIEKGWHLYANPVKHNNEFLEQNQTVVKVSAKEKITLNVDYPAGKPVTEGKEKYNSYVGVIKIQAEVVRAKGDTSPLQISIDVNACTDKICLPQGVVKLTVP
jgi:DsbC/DsbD-like thiol-disulfide interchange protein